MAQRLMDSLPGLHLQPATAWAVMQIWQENQHRKDFFFSISAPFLHLLNKIKLFKMYIHLAHREIQPWLVKG